MLRGLDHPHRRPRSATPRARSCCTRWAATARHYYKRSPAALKKFNPNARPTCAAMRSAAGGQCLPTAASSTPTTCWPRPCSGWGAKGGLPWRAVLCRTTASRRREQSLPARPALRHRRTTRRSCPSSRGCRQARSAIDHVDANCLRQRFGPAVSRDHLFHSVLGLIDDADLALQPRARRHAPNARRQPPRADR